VALQAATVRSQRRLLDGPPPIAFGTKQTLATGLTMSVVDGRPDMPFQRGHFRV
jgi:hypothetical protein